MPRGVSKPLEELSSRQLRRRLKHNPLGVLTGSIQPKQKKHHVSDSEASFCNASRGIRDSISSLCSSDTEDSDGCEQVINTLPAQQDDCVSCLSCICFDCPSCSHSSDRCQHCSKCTIGETYLSDSEPQPSDEESTPSQTDDGETQSQDHSANARVLLASWVNQNHIPHTAIKSLLTILRKCYDDSLPKDQRTLLQTPTNIKCRPCPPSYYWHSGLEKGLKSLKFKDDDSVIQITFNADGIPLSRSSRSSFWPILCSVNDFNKIILVGAYHGTEKPHDANDFLRDFVEELIDLCSHGLVLNGRTIPVEAKCMVCDAQAKSFLLNVKGHGAYFGCTKCMQEGEYVENRVVFPDTEARLRTDQDFRNKVQEEYHHGDTILTKIPNFDLVKDVVLDYQHLILLGVTRKILLLFTSGKLTVRLRSTLIDAISENLESLRAFIPSDFVRKPRSLLYLKQWKATEFRQLLFYTGPLVWSVLERDYNDRYKHFLILHAAVTILSSKSLFGHYGSKYTNDLMKTFVQGFEALYGTEQLSHNVHNLVHISQDVENHGLLDNFSAFRFENYLQQTKKAVRKGNKPLQQLARRYGEVDAAVALSGQLTAGKEKTCEVEYSRRHCSRFLLAGCGDPQYRRFRIRNISFDLSTANRCCGLRDGTVVEIFNVAFNNNLQCMVIIGKCYKTKADFYDYPLPSSYLGIHKVSDLSGLTCWRVDAVSRKYVRFPWKNDHVIFPLLHTDLSIVTEELSL